MIIFKERTIMVKGSGSSSGGGSSSGTIDYPQYMKDQHLAWLNALSVLISDVTTGPSPFAFAVPYDPDSDLAAMWGAVCDLEASVGSLSPLNDFSLMISIATSQIDASLDAPTFIRSDPAADSAIQASVNAWADVNDERIDNEIIPKFNAGMRDIGAVQTAAFILGRAYIESMRNKEVAAFHADLRMRAFLQKDEILAKEAHMENDFNFKLEMSRRDLIINASDKLLTYNIQITEMRRAVAHYALEALRMKIVAKKEQYDKILAIDEMDAKWDLEAYQYGANMLAAIGSGTVATQQRQPSQGASAMGMALSGAASGAMIGSMSANPYGAAIGGAIGFVVGLAGGLLS